MSAQSPHPLHGLATRSLTGTLAASPSLAWRLVPDCLLVSASWCASAHTRRIPLGGLATRPLTVCLWCSSVPVYPCTVAAFSSMAPHEFPQQLNVLFCEA
jgi:hypothetical protein